MRILIGTCAFIAFTTAAYAQVLATEPDSLSTGQTVQVKSKKCKSGIMLVTGGSDRTGGKRVKVCAP